MIFFFLELCDHITQASYFLFTLLNFLVWHKITPYCNVSLELCTNIFCPFEGQSMSLLLGFHNNKESQHSLPFCSHQVCLNVSLFDLASSSFSSKSFSSMCLSCCLSSKSLFLLCSYYNSLFTNVLLPALSLSTNFSFPQ
jgi:hypothetical protein